MNRPISSLALAAAAVATFAATGAGASPRPLPFSYPYETLPTGKLEVEQYLDLVPVRVPEEQPDGTMEGVLSLRGELQTELEYGITDHLEAGWYFVFSQSAGTGQSLAFQGVKQRLRLRLGEAGDWPVNVGLYLEAAEFRNELELEEKILLSRRFGALNVVGNLVLEQEYIWAQDDKKVIYAPSFGASYEISPSFMVGAEYWAKGTFGDDAVSRHYVGPTALVQRGEVFFAVGAYLRVDGVDHSLPGGDPYGRVWIRTLLGIGL